MKTTLTFKKRVSQAKRQKVYEILRRLKFTMSWLTHGDKIVISHDRGDMKPIWIFMMGKCFKDINGNVTRKDK